MSVVINRYTLCALSEFHNLSDSERVCIVNNVDGNDAKQVKDVIRRWIVPLLLLKGHGKIPRGLKAQLAHAILFADRAPLLCDLFEHGEPPFPPPEDVSQYYRWCWEVLYGNDEIQLNPADEYIERHDNTKARLE